MTAANANWSDRRTIAAISTSLVFLLLPLVLNDYHLGVLTFCFYTAVFGMAWDLLFGYLDEVNFGPTFLIGAGAYGAALANSLFGLPIALSLVVAAIASLAGGYLIAAPALRLSGPYFGLVTLAAVLLLQGFLIIFARHTGGELGITLDDVLSIDEKTNYYIAFVFMALSALVMKIIVWSPVGLIMQAVGQDPVAARAMGFNVTKYKMYAFMISAFFSGISGAMMVFYIGAASIDIVVSVLVAVNIIIAVIIGGRRTIIGAIFGALFVVIIGEVLRPVGTLGVAAVFLLALVVIIFWPDGFLGIFRGLRERRL